MIQLNLFRIDGRKVGDICFPWRQRRHHTLSICIKLNCCFEIDLKRLEV